MKGRRKIEMKKMTNKSNLQVAFSKRRSGVFKKASELSTLCDAEACLIIFSPSEKVFSFGHPNVDSVVHRYLIEVAPHVTQFMGVNLHEFNAQLTKFTTQLETEKKRASELKRLHKVVQTQWWRATPTNEMTILQLNEFKGALQQMKINTTRKSEMILIHNAINPTLFFANDNFLA
ncbi:Agamous-like MADS-box protein AGL62 [Glycine soja]|nr:agamous-like MADS-box protein AGL62 [Glycine soja]